MEALLFIHSHGSIIVHTFSWKHYCSYILMEALLFIHSHGSTIVHTFSWKHYCSYILMEALLLIHSRGSIIGNIFQFGVVIECKMNIFIIQLNFA